MQISKIEAAAWDIPMRSPYRSAQRITTTARNVLVTVTLDSGIVGYGESAPAAYVTGETQESVIAAINGVANRQLSGDSQEFLDSVRPNLVATPGALSALVMAVLDAEAQTRGIPLFSLLGAPADAATTRATDLSLPILSPSDAGIRAADAAKAGFRAIKIKVGSGDIREDVARVQAVAQSAPDATIRLDGNQGFTADEAVRFVDSLSALIPRIEMFEQPTKAKDDSAMAFVAQRVACTVFADESVHSPADARRLVEAGICGGVVLKLAKADLLTVRDLAKGAFAAGGKCMFGCMMETRIAVTAALHLTVALGSGVVPLLDLDGHLLTNDAGLVQGGLTQTADRLSLDPVAPGLGATALTRQP